MKTLLEIRMLFKRRVLEIVRQPVWLISGLITPLLYIALFAPLLKKAMVGPGGLPMTTKQLLDSFVPGILTLIAFGSGMGVGWDIIDELHTGVIERLRVTPARRFSLLAGTVLRDIVDFLVPAVIVIFVSWLFGFDVRFGGLLILLFLLCLLTATVSAWSGSMGLILKQMGSLAAVVTGVQLPLTLLSGMLLPMNLAPKWLWIIAHINPMFYTVEASTQLAGGVIACSQTLVAFCVIVPLTAITMFWATRVYNKAIA